MRTCNQHGCDEAVVALYTWPGKDEAGICAKHRPKLEATANALGFYLQIKPIGTDLAPDHNEQEG